ncbi:toprim domain-containing protein [Sphingomonas aliaeris]|uniref:Toprim domain-containing protein n=1 Tax=Sphingomonas aliaeris TaxID=2759526 RepID=A0A974S3G7_9SPHN|nr:CHC2 zinc finger domain-containing protein [Sphingomonas aliaeris]QQV76513.1 toprim domain-containing protein [Sphingomonas aliaeris]
MATPRHTPRRRGVDEAEFRRLVDEAKARHNLSDVIGRHTKLKRRGGREMVGLCPFHSEKSPSFEVNDTKGTYHCWGCGVGGDAMSFLMKRDGMSFRDAYQALAGDAFPLVSPEEQAKRKREDAEALSRRIAVAREIWDSSVPPEGTAAEVYARQRGITGPLPDSVRFVMTARYRNDETGEIGRDYPAMVCALQNADDVVVGVQCVFLADGGKRKFERLRPDGSTAKAKLSFGAIVGSAFRTRGMTAPIGDEIVVCEGPEDGLTLAQEFPDRSTWVACGTALMPQLQMPARIRRVVLAGDNNAAGRLAVETAITALGERGLAVRAMWPADGYKDWNDMLRGIKS